MNAVEHIVECYFQICRHCFTMHDVKVEHGNNRQFDLVAVNNTEGTQYHVESSVTHCEQWNPTADELLEEFDVKFRGRPRKKEGARTDSAKGKDYWKEICDAYRSLGLEPDKVKRVYVCWIKPEQALLSEMLRRYSSSGPIKAIEVLSFRDEILTDLLARVKTSNYDDEVLRTLSLLSEKSRQTTG